METGAAVKRQIRARNDLAWLAWHTAVLTRVKDMPKLKELMISDGKSKRRFIPTPEQQFAQMSAWIEATNKDKK